MRTGSVIGFNAFAIVAAVSLVSAGAFGAPKFFLPERICAAPGLECNIYFKDEDIDSVHKKELFGREVRTNESQAFAQAVVS